MHFSTSIVDIVWEIKRGLNSYNFILDTRKSQLKMYFIHHTASTNIHKQTHVFTFNILKDIFQYEGRYSYTDAK